MDHLPTDIRKPEHLLAGALVPFATTSGSPVTEQELANSGKVRYSYR